MDERKLWLSGSSFRCCSIMYDRCDGSIWVDCFLDCNSLINYHSSDVFDLTDIILGHIDYVVTFDNLVKAASMVDDGCFDWIF